jgi:hypothetical protein
VAGASGAVADTRGREPAPPKSEGSQLTAPAPPSDAEAYAKTKLAKGTPTAPMRRSGSPVPIIAVGAVLLVGGGLAIRYITQSTTTTVTPIVMDDGGQRVPAVDAATAGVSDADKLRMVAELEALPRAASAWRGVQSEDYLALLSAVDGALCLTPAGQHDLVIPGEEHARLEREKLVPEAMAVGRYLLATGELPPRVTVSLQAFLRSHAPFSTRAPSWAFARLGALVSPDDAALRRAVIQENGALSDWREPSPEPQPFAALCERQAAVDAYLAKARDPDDVARAKALQRYLKATPFDMPVVDGGLRFVVTDSERDEAAATILVRVRVTNPTGEDKSIALGNARLAGLDAAPAIDPPAFRLNSGLVRDLRLTFSGVTDAVADAAVLVLKPGIELQAYSEDLR